MYDKKKNRLTLPVCFARCANKYDEVSVAKKWTEKETSLLHTIITSDGPRPDGHGADDERRSRCVREGGADARLPQTDNNIITGIALEKCRRRTLEISLNSHFCQA